MDWMDEVQGNLKKRRQILFSKDSAFLQDLAFLLSGQSHRTVVLWAFALAEEGVKELEKKYPAEDRPRLALEASRLWAAGRIKMPIAKRAILDCHGMAKEIQSAEDIALCHAIGQACGTVHTSGHAMGFPIYELTALVRRYGPADCRAPVEARKRDYIEKIMYWGAQDGSDTGEWADFMKG